MVITTIRDDNGHETPVIMTERGESNPFSSGSVGYYASGKVMVNGVEHQATFNLTVPHSANAERAKLAAKLANEKAARRQAAAARK